VEQARAFVPSIGQQGGTFRISTTIEPETCNPLSATEPQTKALLDFTYEGLVAVGGVDGEFVPALARSWDRSEDGLQWTFYLRRDVFWSDSIPFTSGDVVYTYERIVEGGNATSLHPNSRFSVEEQMITFAAVDTYTVRFTLPAPFSPFLGSVTRKILPKHLQSDNGEIKAMELTEARERFDNVVGTGPFIPAEFSPGRRLVLRRNPHYWKTDSAGQRLPYFDSVIVSILPDLHAQSQSFTEGNLDYLVARAEDFDFLRESQVERGFRAYRLGPAADAGFLVLNQNTGRNPITGGPYVDTTKVKWFRDDRFRRAVSYALNRREMIDSVFGGNGYPQWGPMSPANGFFYSGELTQYPYNPDKARRLLGDMGFTDTDGDGILEDESGIEVSFRLITNQGNRVRVRLTDLIRENLAELGVNVTTSELPWSEILRRMQFPPYQWEAALIGMSGSPEPHHGLDVWASGGVHHFWFPAQDEPSTEWEADIDSLFAAAAITYDRDERKRLYAEWQKIVSDELPLIFTVSPERIVCITERVKNVNPSTVGGVLHNIEYLFTEN